MTPKPLLLSIGTTHPWNAAGVGLDARVAGEYGAGHAMCVVAVSAQDRGGLHLLEPLSAAAVEAQLQCVPDPAAIRVGALVSSAAVRIVAQYLRERATRVPAVIDPVMSASLGGELAADDAFETAFAEELLPLPCILTPNLPEAARLTGDAEANARELAAALVKRGASAVLVKGGHGEGDPEDVLADARGVRAFRAPRLAGEMRGTGCVLAAALACELLLGRSLDESVERARAYVRSKIAARIERGGMQVAF